MKKLIRCSVNINQYYELGPTYALPYRQLKAGVSGTDIKHMEGTEGSIMYMIMEESRKVDSSYGKTINQKYYGLQPLKIEKVKITEPDGRYIRTTEYSVYAKTIPDNQNRFYSTRNSFDINVFYTPEEAQKLIDNANAIIEEDNYLQNRESEIDKTTLRNALNLIHSESKIVESDTFGNGECEVQIGASENETALRLYLYVKPTDGPFMSSSIYEIYYRPMTDGIVYRSYGAFSHATSRSDWFRNSKGNVSEITVDDMYDDIKELQSIYDTICVDGFDDIELSRIISKRYR